MQALSFLDHSTHHIFLQQELTDHQTLKKMLWIRQQQEAEVVRNRGIGQQVNYCQNKFKSTNFVYLSLVLNLELEIKLCLKKSTTGREGGKSKLAFLSKCISRFLQQGTKSFSSEISIHSFHLLLFHGCLYLLLFFLSFSPSMWRKLT